MADSTRHLMLGNEAIARGAWEAGVRVATAYPGTPSTEITEFIATYPEIDAEFSVNEKVALEIGIGACIAGARSLVSMKHVGLNVAMDPLLSIAYPGVNAGLVVVVADDPGQHSSQNEQDTRYFGVAGKLPVLEPADSQECLDFVRDAFALSERFDTVVIVRLTTRVAHGMGLVQTHPRETVQLKEHDPRVGKYIVAPAFAKKRRIVAEQTTGGPRTVRGDLAAQPGRNAWLEIGRGDQWHGVPVRARGRSAPEHIQAGPELPATAAQLAAVCSGPR